MGYDMFIVNQEPKCWCDGMCYGRGMRNLLSVCTTDMYFNVPAL